MNARDAFNLADRADRFNKHLQTFGFLIRRQGNPPDDALWNMHTGYVLRHPAQGFRIAQRSHPDDDLATPMQAALARRPHEHLEHGKVEAELRLDEFRSVLDLTLEIDDAIRKPRMSP